ncbi:MAG TPA: sensor histidine kinase KdpD [Geminicoccaceae bacterium]|nr:sensor histidine kinase KdpD [Geminicoccus sp.]HMU50858.1 sensor histidine kinase KdpD [Geminicoccaceae bacterium]
MAEGSTRGSRPSPDALLALADAESRGKLKIFLGAAPGVGKTYEMLEAGRRRAHEGVDVVVGIVETHGRRETAALLEGLEILPRRRVPYKGRILEELDLDGLLARRPALALVDELAHDNAPGSRHPKRWQDVEELLAAGIEVWTTLNIQHVESLNDVVAQITRIRVGETVPDRIIDAAEVELVDLTPGELRERLSEGKVYVPEEAGRALDHFFSQGNLTALRELALRRTAQRVDDQMLQYMRAHGLAGPWAANDRLLVCVHDGTDATELVRYGKRLADRLKAPWTALHVQGRADAAAQARVAETLRLAERLGAETLVLPGDRVADEALAWSHANNITQIVIGSARRRGWLDRLREPLPRSFIRDAGEVIVHVLPSPDGGDAARPAAARPRALLPAYLLALLPLAAAIGVAMLIEHWIHIANIALVFLVPVLLAALWYGLGPAMLTVAGATLAYDFLFTEPYFTFAISDPENVTTMLLFSVAAALTSGLAARARERATVARQEAARSAMLYGFARKLASVAVMDDLLWAAAHQIAAMLKVEAVILLPEDGRLALAAAYPPEDRLDDTDLAAAQWAFERNEAAGRGSDTLAAARRLFLPAHTGRGVVAVVGVQRAGDGPSLTPEERRVLDAVLDQTALAVERVRLARDVDETRMLAETERLRTALLTSLSHDVRTPLASILGTVSSLRSFGLLYDDETRDEMLRTAQEEAERLSRYLDNLLDMTRLEGGALGPKREPVDLADMAGAALRRVGRLLSGHRVITRFPDDLPLARLDFMLIEQVLVNLLENAARYAPRGSEIEIAARRDAAGIAVEVADRGPGLTSDEAARVFDKLYRGETSAGAGLGLAVCKGFVEAMGGSIGAAPRPGGGSVFTIRFPAELLVDVG